MVLVIILAIVAAGMLWLSLGRHVIIGRANESESNQQLALGVQSQVQACFDGTTYGQTDCTVPPSAQACLASHSLPASPNGGVWPNCTLAVSVGQ